MSLRHIKDPKFTPHFDVLPRKIQTAARKSFALLRSNPKHPSLHFKRVKDVVWSARILQGSGGRGSGWVSLVLDRETCGV